MALLNWRDELSVNVKVFNTHHKRLVDLINELHDAMLAGRTQDVVERTLRSLFEYTKYHFTEEERLMLEKDYPGFADHKGQHDTFIRKVRSWIRKCEEGNINQNIEVMGFLREWLNQHIMGTDKKYTNFFNARGVI